MSSIKNNKDFDKESDDFEELEWTISKEDNCNSISNNLKSTATSGYPETNVRVDQIGPYRIAFKTHDDLKYRIDYNTLYQLIKPLQDYLKLPIYIGGSNSPLSKKMPNKESDIDIYVITDMYSYDESKELNKKINEFIKDKPQYSKCSIGQVEREWLNLSYFYEAVPIEEKKWWELNEEEKTEMISKRKKESIENMKRKARQDVIKDIERIYNLKLNEEDIISVMTTPRWRSINDCSFRRGNMMNKGNSMKLNEIMQKMDYWLKYTSENTTLYEAIKNSSKTKNKNEKIDKMSAYLKISYKNGKYWLFNSIVNFIAEAFSTDAKEIYWLIDSDKVEDHKKIERQIQNITSSLSKYFKKKIKSNFVDLDKFFEENGYTNQLEELKKANKKYRKICNLDLETKLYAFNRLNKINKLFIINADGKVGKLLKKSGLKVSIPFINKYLNDFKSCPEYAKKPPAGYCLKGSIQLMLGKLDTYKCTCEEENSKDYRLINNLWTSFEKELDDNEKNEEPKTISKEFSVVDKTVNHNIPKAIILFGSPSIDSKNLLLIKLAKLYSKEDTTILVEDIMAPYLYKEGVFNKEEVMKMYKTLETEGVKVDFNSEDVHFLELVDKWLKQLTIKDLKKISPLTENSNIFGFHVYDALHLAIMGATQEKVKDKIGIVHAYNEAALHIFNKKIGNTAGYISCHKIPEIEIRLKDEKEKNKIDLEIENAIGNMSILYKNKDSKLISIHSFSNPIIIKGEREEDER